MLCQSSSTDGSQTLYEFRASNPKALNVLEGSGVFQTYQLQTNYRSNQEILDFANVALQNIEANQYAHIQLQANSLAPVTEKSFTTKVHFHYERLPKISDFEDRFQASLMAQVIRPYVTAKLAAGEQIAFLAFTRKHVNMFQNMIKKAFPNISIISLVPDKQRNSTIFSMFILKYWTSMQFLPTSNIVGMIQQSIIQHLADILRHDPQKQLPGIQVMLTRWAYENGPQISAWQRAHVMGAITMDQLMENVKESMLNFEIQNNAARQRVRSAHNEQQKKLNLNTKADIIVSTIHSAKGLEFDNVILLYRNENTMEEADKRMYYVGFTRAKKTELVLAYDTVAKPRIQEDYNTIVKALHAKAVAAGQNVTPVKPVSIPRAKPVSGINARRLPVVDYGDIFPVITDKIPEDRHVVPCMTMAPANNDLLDMDEPLLDPLQPISEMELLELQSHLPEPVIEPEFPDVMASVTDEELAVIQKNDESKT